MTAVCDEHGADLPDDVIVAHGAQSADGHESGSGPLAAGEPVVVDIWPRDRASRCWADMTRTFVAGGGGAVARAGRVLGADEGVARARLPRGARRRRRRGDLPPLVRALHRGRQADAAHQGGRARCCATATSTALGHGVGLEVHESPGLGRAPDTLRTGDVITLEPGCYRQGYGGCRLEDLVVVTDDGYELLTDFPYDL